MDGKKSAKIISVWREIFFFGTTFFVLRRPWSGEKTNKKFFHFFSGPKKKKMGRFWVIFGPFLAPKTKKWPPKKNQKFFLFIFSPDHSMGNTLFFWSKNILRWFTAGLRWFTGGLRWFTAESDQKSQNIFKCPLVLEWSNLARKWIKIFLTLVTNLRWFTAGLRWFTGGLRWFTAESDQKSQNIFKCPLVSEWSNLARKWIKIFLTLVTLVTSVTLVTLVTLATLVTSL